MIRKNRDYFFLLNVPLWAHTALSATQRLTAFICRVLPAFNLRTPMEFNASV
jgi:hypothetical protein